MANKKGEFIVKYTTKDVMDKLNDISKRIDEVHQQTAKTNGQVKFHTKLIYASFSFTMAVLMIFVAYLVGLN